WGESHCSPPAAGAREYSSWPATSFPVLLSLSCQESEAVKLPQNDARLPRAAEGRKSLWRDQNSQRGNSRNARKTEFPLTQSSPRGNSTASAGAGGRSMLRDYVRRGCPACWAQRWRACASLGLVPPLCKTERGLGG